MKTCKKCNINKEQESFGKDSYTKDKLKVHCKECKNKGLREYRKLNSEKIRAKDRADKKLYRTNNKEKIRLGKKVYYCKNKEKVGRDTKKYREDNKEKVSSYQKEYNSLNKETIKKDKQVYYLENKEEVDRKNKIYRDNNKDKIKGINKIYIENNKERKKITDREYRENNRGKTNAISAKRHAKKLLATPRWLSKSQLLEIEEFYILAQELAWLNQDGKPFHVDHIIPLQGKEVCGLHVPWNLQLLPASINISKGNRLK